MDAIMTTVENTSAADPQGTRPMRRGRSVGETVIVTFVLFFTLLAAFLQLNPGGLTDDLQLILQLHAMRDVAPGDAEGPITISRYTSGWRAEFGTPVTTDRMESELSHLVATLTQDETSE